MAMVGLFWIVEGDVYVGAKPSGLAPGVRLTSEGVLGLGDRQAALYLWEDIRGLDVVGAPVKTLSRQVGAVTDLVVGAVMNMGVSVGVGRADEGPPTMTLGVETDGGTHELTAYSAAAVGYSAEEVELSRKLLVRLTEGAATMSTTLAAMAEWGRAWEDGGSPRAAERERLLREWAA